jgi:hypothetical protein
MPQGSPKKIEVDLLLADLALQLGDPPSRPRQLALARRRHRPLRGRPRSRNAAGPPVRTLSRHAYKSRPRSFRSRATSAMLSPAATRTTAACFNAIGYSRCFISSSLRETVPYFLCLTFGVHYSEAPGIFLRI